MANLSRKKINSNRFNRYHSVLDDVEIFCSRDNITGEVSITINGNGEEGEEKFRLLISQKELKELEWLFN